eukprot:CCRYP_015286-RA/>CCRYP_015286-RA protein AED:0.24 eAED:0.24 QI:0/0/0/1/0/0/2/0/218
MLYKIHKPRTPHGFPTGPLCADVSSLPHGLGKWVDIQLQQWLVRNPPISGTRPCSKGCFPTLTSHQTPSSSQPTLRHTFHHYDTKALIEALEIDFKNNILQFGDTYWKQILGTGMGIAPAPPWATIYYAIHENSVLPRWTSQVLLYRRFIDDIISIWVCDGCPKRNHTLWTQFQANMQQWHGLEWEFSPLSQSCNYMDLTLTLSRRTIHPTLFEKAQN